MPHPKDRIGPIEAAIRDRDKAALFAVLSQRTQVDPESGCWRWLGQRTPASYPTVGYGPSNRFVHRLSAWADSGFKGDLKDLGPVHHACAERLCWRPTHVFEVTTKMNILEANLRKAVRRRFQAYEAALRDVAPNHRVLTQFTPLDETPGLGPAERFDSPAERRRKQEATERLEERRRLNRELRFQQIRDVHRLHAEGLTRKEAIAQVGIGRRVYERWLPDFRALDTTFDTEIGPHD